MRALRLSLRGRLREGSRAEPKRVSLVVLHRRYTVAYQMAFFNLVHVNELSAIPFTPTGSLSNSFIDGHSVRFLCERVARQTVHMASVCTKCPTTELCDTVNSPKSGLSDIYHGNPANRAHIRRQTVHMKKACKWLPCPANCTHNIMCTVWEATKLLDN